MISVALGGRVADDPTFRLGRGRHNGGGKSALPETGAADFLGWPQDACGSSASGAILTGRLAIERRRSGEIAAVSLSQVSLFGGWLPWVVAIFAWAAFALGIAWRTRSAWHWLVIWAGALGAALGVAVGCRLSPRPPVPGSSGLKLSLIHI